MSSDPGGSDPGQRPPRAGRRSVGSDPAASQSGAMAATSAAVASGPEAAPTATPATTIVDAGSLGEMVGTTIAGRYAIHRKIGQGGMGAVFEATHLAIGRKVAVKVLLDKYARREAIVARLEQEAKLASSIGHEHIIDILDLGTTDDGRTFVAMELLEGESLAELLARTGPLPEARILRLGAQVASALSAAHARGIIHRDVKPENLFIVRRGDADFVKVVDFGISKSLRASDPDGEASPRLTHTGMVLGTPLYMSPEQARGDEALDHRIDIYALGVILYECATGRVPFLGSNYLAVISQVLAEDAVPPRQLRPELSEEFEAIVLRAMDKDREHRYPDAAALRADLLALEGDPGHSTERAKITPPRRPVERPATRVLAWVAGVAVLVAALAVTVVVLMRGATPGAPVSAPVPAALPPDARPPAPPDAQPTSRVVEVRIESEPSGATIYRGSVDEGKTPLVLRVGRDGAPVELTARLADHAEAPFTVDPAVDAGRTTPLMVRLTPLPHRPGGRPTRPARPPRPPAAGSAAGSARPGPAGAGDLEGNPHRNPR